MIVIGIDPGTTQSAWVEWDGTRILSHSKDENKYLLANLRFYRLSGKVLAIEWIESMGMRVGKEVFITCRWVGQFAEAWGSEPIYVPRSQVKLHLCGQRRANDADIRQALKDRFGEPGKKAAPGLTYGLKADTWQAFAVAVVAWDLGNA